MERRSTRFEQETEGPAWRDRLHDLKNPLSAILANCQYLLVHGALSTENLEVVGDIADSARALREMLEEAQGQVPRGQKATGGNSAAGRAK